MFQTSNLAYLPEEYMKVVFNYLSHWKYIIIILYIIF